MRQSLVVLLVAVGCSPAVPPASPTGAAFDLPTEASRIVQAQIEAYNAHDVAALMQYYADSATIYQHPAMPLLVGGRAIRADFADWFAKAPSVHVAITGRVAAERYVIDHERLTGVPAGGPSTAIVIYHVAENRIQAVWLFEPVAPAPAELAAAAIVRLEQAWADAEARHDGVTVAGLLSEDHVVTTPDGHLFDRAAVLAAIRGDTTTVASATVSDARVQADDHMAVITGVTTQVLAGDRAHPRRYRWTDTWRRGADGQWRCVASQSMVLTSR